MAKRRKYLTDTNLGIRPINVIDALPVKDLTDDEITKLFFYRFDADALVMTYVERDGQLVNYHGRVRKEVSYRLAYRKLIEALESIKLIQMIDGPNYLDEMPQELLDELTDQFTSEGERYANFNTMWRQVLSEEPTPLEMTQLIAELKRSGYLEIP
ncbi:hypothetical protein [uncultured Spirosoma sp.]|uniref:hypothetical protein n=1 Tax=uncultured Spirosoma sp. TaxID=278208 RepID=UPI002589767F|nr:hypothetical protein [uncultured Spirosoma sp.]